MALALAAITAASCAGNDSPEKKIIGDWCNPYTYKSTGELKGFRFEKGGKCSAINIPSWDLRTWKIDEEGYLIIEGFEIGEDGTQEEYLTRERIEVLNRDSLVVVAREEAPKMSFVYLNTKSIDRLVNGDDAE